MYEVTGLSEASVREQTATIETIAKRHLSSSSRSICDPGQVESFWRRRKECLWSAMAAHPDRDVMITDVCVPLSKLPVLMVETQAWIAESGLHVPIVAHAGDGNIHCFVFFDKHCPREVRVAHDLSKKMALRAIELGGTCTGEHGIGVGKRDYLEREIGVGALGLMHTIKHAVDPTGILNPGKILKVKK